MNKNELRKKLFKSLLMLIVSLIFISCSNLFGNGDASSEGNQNDDAGKQKTITIIGSIKISEELTGSGAIPEEYSGIFDSSNKSKEQSNERTAFPVVPEGTGTSYYVTATNEGGQVLDSDKINLTTTTTGATFSIILPINETETIWTIEAGFKADFNGSTVTILKDSYDATISNTTSTFYHDFELKPLSSGNGNIDLTIAYQTSGTADELELYFENSKITPDTTNGESISPTKIILKNKAAGSYKAKLVFKKNGYVVYIDYQGITVFPNMTTTKWVNNGGYCPITDSNTYYITDSLVQNYLITQIYVGSTTLSGIPFSADDTNGNGTIFAPFATFAKAIDYLQKNGDTSKDYTIWISGEISGAQTISDGTTTSPTPVKAQSLTISGVTGNTSDILKGGSSGSVLYLDTSVPVKISNLTITGGSGTTVNSKLYGGGLYINKGSVELTTGAVVNGNTADIGGGICLASGSLFLNRSAVVGNSGVSECAQNENGEYGNKATISGGGIAVLTGTLWLGYSPGTTPAEVDTNGGVFYNLVANNAACHGGGIDNNNGTVRIRQGKVSYNYACGTGSGDNDVGSGGGISTANEFYMSGEAEVSNNKAAYGGGVYITKDSSNGSFSMSGGTIKSNNAEQQHEKYGDGGGVAIGDGGTFTMTAGTMQSNYAVRNGGAVFISNSVLFDMQGGTIGDEDDDDGNDYKNFVGENGNGGAIYNDGTFQIRNTAWLPFGGAEKLNDIYLPSGKYVKLMNNVSHDTTATITPAVWTRGTQVLDDYNIHGTNINNNSSKFALSDSGFSIGKYQPDSKYLGIIKGDIYVSGEDGTRSEGIGSPNDITGRGTTAKPYATIAKAISQCWNSNDDYTIYIDGQVLGAQSIGGNGVTINAKTITLQGTGSDPCLDANNSGRPLTINTSKEVTIKSLTIKNGKLTSGDGGGISVAGGCTLTLDDEAQILSNDNYTANTSGKGGGIYIANSNTVIMKSGSLVNLNRAKEGGGIYNLGKLLMYGTARVGSTVTTYPTNPWASNPQTPTGNCSKGAGGGIYNAGTICLGYSAWKNTSDNQISNLSNGITGNFSEGQGGGIYINSNSNLYFNTGNISYNRGVDRGGGVYIYEGTMTMSGGTMTSNCHDGNLSGAIHVNGNLYLSGETYIPYGFADNSWYENGAKNNVYVDTDNNRVFTITGNLTHPGTVAKLSTSTQSADLQVIKKDTNFNLNDFKSTIDKFELVEDSSYSLEYKQISGTDYAVLKKITAANFTDKDLIAGYYDYMDKGEEGFHASSLESMEGKTLLIWEEDETWMALTFSNVSGASFKLMLKIYDNDGEDLVNWDTDKQFNLLDVYDGQENAYFGRDGQLYCDDDNGGFGFLFFNCEEPYDLWTGLNGSAGAHGFLLLE